MKPATHSRCAAVFLVLVLIGCISSTTRAAHAVSRGDQAFARGNFKQALAEYSDATRLDRLNGRAYLGVGKADIRLGKTAQAEPALIRAVDTLHDWPSIGECYVELANTYTALHGDVRSYLDAAASMASHLLEHDSNSFEGHRIWAEVARLQASLQTSQTEAAGWRSKALQEFATADQLRPGQPRVLSSWALTLRANGDLENAKAMYLRLLRLQPGNISVLGALYSLGLEQQHPADAEDYLQRSLHLGSADQRALFPIVSDAIAFGRNDDAGKILNVLAERNQDPDRVSALFFKAGFPDQGLKVLQQAITRNPSKARHYFEEATQKLVILEKNSLADRTAAACLAQYRDDVPCRAVKLFEDYQSASKSSDLEALQVLAARYSTNPLVRLYLGRISQQKGRVEDARIQYNLGLSADPNNADLRLALANLEIISGVPDAARADAQNLLREDPQNRAALEILNRTAPKIQPQ